MKALALTLGLLVSTLAFGWTMVTEENLATETGSATGLVVFTGEQCSMCQEYLSVLEKLEADFPSLKLMKVDVDASPELGQFFAPVIPMTYFLVGGEIVANIQGTGTEEQVRNALKDFVRFIDENK